MEGSPKRLRATSTIRGRSYRRNSVEGDILEEADPRLTLHDRGNFMAGSLVFGQKYVLSRRRHCPRFVKYRAG